MSMGYGVYAKLDMMDDTMILYQYCCYNLNKADYELYSNLLDGKLWIQRDSLVEGERYLKRVKKTSGKKIILEKKRKIELDFSKLLRERRIEIENASGTWYITDEGYDVMALRIIYRIYEEYQMTGVVPKKISFFS